MNSRRSHPKHGPMAFYSCHMCQRGYKPCELKPYMVGGNWHCEMCWKCLDFVEHYRAKLNYDLVLYEMEKKFKN